MKRTLIALCCLIVVCLPVRPAAGKFESDSLSLKERVQIFETVWKTINEEYYDPTFNGVNWSGMPELYRSRVEATKSDEEFYPIIRQMLLKLHDLHTSFVAPGALPSGSGVSVSQVEEQVVVVEVEPDSDAARAGVKAGMIVRTFDGQLIDARLAELRLELGHWTNEPAYRLYLSRALLRGPANTTFKLGLERADATRFEVGFTRREIPSSKSKLISYTLPSGFSYLKINGAIRSPVDDQFESEFKNLKASRGLIIDLRGVNGGDIKGVGLKIANYFFPVKVSFGKFINRSGGTPLYRSLSAESNGELYRQPVVILIDETTRSAAEVFAKGFQENGRAKIIGRQSCGCVLDRSTKNLKGGAILYYSHLGYVSSKGHKLEGSGVVPDKTIMETISTLRQGRDATLEEAENVLKALQSPSK